MRHSTSAQIGQTVGCRSWCSWHFKARWFMAYSSSTMPASATMSKMSSFVASSMPSNSDPYALASSRNALLVRHQLAKSSDSLFGSAIAICPRLYVRPCALSRTFVRYALAAFLQQPRHTSRVRSKEMTRRSRGEGTIYFANGAWRARIRLHGRERVWQFATKRAAERKLREVVSSGSAFRPPHDLTVGDWLGQWLNAMEIARPRTVETYRQKLSHAIAELGDMRLSAVTPSDVTGVLEQCKRTGLSATTTHHVYRTMSTAFTAALRQGILMQNPCRDAVRPKRGHFEALTLSPEEFARLAAEASRDDKVGAMVLLAMATGMRKGELLALRWTDIDWNTRTIAVVRSVRWLIGQGPVVGPPKTHSGKRTIPIDEAMTEQLRRHHVRIKAMQLHAGEKWRDQGLVFPARTGHFLSPSGPAYDNWTALRSRARVQPVRFHDLRHTVGLYITRQFGIVVASRILGHSNPMITARYYGHAYIDDFEKVATSLSQVMFEGVTQTPIAGDMLAPE